MFNLRILAAGMCARVPVEDDDDLLDREQLRLQNIELLGDDEGNDDQEGDGDEENNGSNDDINDDPLVWCNDLENHSCGVFSYAVAQANSDMQGHSQVEIGSNGVFVGIYDGHVGPHTAKYINSNLFTNLIGILRERGTISEGAIDDAIGATEQGFLDFVEREQQNDPWIVVNGSSCLVGIIWKGDLYIAHLGLSRAVLGMTASLDSSPLVLPVALTREHNMANYRFYNRGWDWRRIDPDFIIRGDDGVWRIKGISKTWRSIGDAYLKRAEFVVHPSLVQFHLPSPLRGLALSSEPYLFSRSLHEFDSFFIFGSPGFWKHVTSLGARDIITTNRRRGIARKLVKAALEEAARKAGIAYSDLRDIPKGTSRREIHDDMTVIVVFIDYHRLGKKDTNLEQRSFKAFTDAAGQSDFRSIDDLM